MFSLAYQKFSLTVSMSHLPVLDVDAVSPDAEQRELHDVPRSIHVWHACTHALVGQ